MEQALKSGQLPADLEIIDTDPVTVDTNTNVDKMITESEKEAKDGTSDVNEQKMMGLQTWSGYNWCNIVRLIHSTKNIIDGCSFRPGQFLTQLKIQGKRMK